MDCNRDEALRAKQIAERKFTAKDVAAAKKFALKAHNLNPELEGISQMLATLDVYLAAENKIAGETDWYAILNVSATADDETVKKQYRKLALTLHPDKNKSIGADGAFKFLSEAWSVLSDKTRRTAYDQKRNAKGSQQKASQPSRNQSAPNANGSHKSANTTSSNTRPPKSAARSAPTTAPATAPATTPAVSRQSKPNTFWTSCNLCKMQYEYLRVYLNHNLLCPNCHKPFLAVETGTPTNGSNASVPWSFPQQRQQNANHNAANKTAYGHGRNASTVPNMGTAAYQHAVGHNAYNHVSYQWATFSTTPGVATVSAPAGAQAANVVHHTYDKVRRDREESLRRRNYSSRRTSSGSHAANNNAASTSNVAASAERPTKKRRDDDGGNHFGGTNGTNANMGVFETDRANGISSSLLEMRNLLMEKARIEIRKKLNEWNSGKGAKSVAANVNSNDPNKLDGSADGNKQGPSAVLPKPVVITVPDPDFHDFDKDRTEASFDANQVWAAYDDDDGMPRFYALIQKVISLKPFKMRFSWLNSKSNTELGPVNWVGSGFTKTCGEFRVGRYEVNNTVNVFSHRVRWDKGVRGVVKILPRQGETWALYRNWSPDWSETTPDDVIHKYDMVEVLEDYNEELGVVSVTPLVKVAGFKTVFHKHMDPDQVKRIPREELFRFSHQVPSWLLTGEEAQNAPKGCRELDPAATPLELLQVITETRDEVVETAKQQPAS
ncbi:uncharacterized protein LOC131239457 [Magnolia sinica]|uniref:uncharacterized protein LOC131239457 n=1 Tax=Magnolia sinica TaxID=86752 RepID=UPI002657D362|nr:uncharacterized protein LOC131239457 [Magnolia sinica]